MTRTQNTPNRLIILVDPAWERALVFGMMVFAFILGLSQPSHSPLLLLIVFEGSLAFFLWNTCPVELDFQRATHSLAITKSLFRWTRVKTLPLAAIKGVKVINDDGSAFPRLLLQDRNGRKSHYSLTGAASHPADANDLAQIITQWLVLPPPV